MAAATGAPTRPRALIERRERIPSTARIDTSRWIAGPVLGLEIVSLHGLANKRFGDLARGTDLVHGSGEGHGARRPAIQRADVRDLRPDEQEETDQSPAPRIGRSTGTNQQED